MGSVVFLLLRDGTGAARTDGSPRQLDLTPLVLERGGNPAAARSLGVAPSRFSLSDSPGFSREAPAVFISCFFFCLFVFRFVCLFLLPVRS